MILTHDTSTMPGFYLAAAFVLLQWRSQFPDFLQVSSVLTDGKKLIVKVGNHTLVNEKLS